MTIFTLITKQQISCYNNVLCCNKLTLTSKQNDDLRVIKSSYHMPVAIQSISIKSSLFWTPSLSPSIIIIFLTCTYSINDMYHTSKFHHSLPLFLQIVSFLLPSTAASLQSPLLAFRTAQTARPVVAGDGSWTHGPTALFVGDAAAPHGLE